MSLEVYIGNFPSRFTSDDLSDLFRDFEGIHLKSFIKVDKKSFAFLICVDKEQVVDVVSSMHDIDVCGRNLIVRASDKELQNVISLSLLENDVLDKHPRNTTNKHSVTQEKKDNYGINYKTCNYELVPDFPKGVRFNNPRLHFTQTAMKDTNVFNKQADGRQLTQSERGNKNDSQGNLSSLSPKERPISAQAYYKHVRQLNSPDQGSSIHKYNSESKNGVNDSGTRSYHSRDGNSDLPIDDYRKPFNSEESTVKPIFNTHSEVLSYNNNHRAGDYYEQSNTDDIDSISNFLDSGVHISSPKGYSGGHKNVTHCKQSSAASSNEKNVGYKMNPTSYYPKDSGACIKSSSDCISGPGNSDFINSKSTDKADSFSYNDQNLGTRGQSESNYNKVQQVQDGTQSRSSYYQGSDTYGRNRSNFNNGHQVDGYNHSRQSYINRESENNGQNPNSYANGHQPDEYRQSSSDYTQIKNKSMSDYSKDNGTRAKNTNYYNDHLVDDYSQSKQSRYGQDSEFHGKHNEVHQNVSTYNTDYRQSSSACSNSRNESYYQHDDRYNVIKSTHDNGVDVSDNACAADLSDEQVSKEDLFYVSVANFPLYTSVDDLYELFEDFGPCDIVMICNYPRADKKPTEAIICFETQSSATDAILNFDNTSYFGRGLVVTDATDISMVPTLLNGFK